MVRNDCENREPGAVPGHAAAPGHPGDRRSDRLDHQLARDQDDLQAAPYQRQDEVSQEYADLLANKIVIPSKIIDTLVKGERAGIFIDTVHRQIEQILDTKMGLFKGAMLLTMGTEPYRKMKDQVTLRIVELLPRHIHRMEDYWRESMDLKTTIHERLSGLPEAEFEQVLRTCFKQDEGILIAVGGALGLVAGMLQLLLLL